MLIKVNIEKIYFRWIIYRDGKISEIVKWIWKINMI